MGDFCSCGSCIVMRTKDECFCCSSMNYQLKVLCLNLSLRFGVTIFEISDQCIVQHPIVKDLLNKSVLEINLRQDLELFC